MNIEEYEQIVPNVQAYGLTWITPNRTCAWRVNSLMTKEPDTVAWIEQMEPEKVFFDVGANMGQYSMLAAQRKLRVHAFEPESQNFALLCRNIAVNKLQNNVTAWPLAVSNWSGPAPFYVQQLLPGNSCNSFDEAVNFHLESKQYAFQQGAFGVALDCFCNDTGYFPDYIKIDVDGFEHKVLDGGMRALHNVKSILVETNTHLPEHRAMEEVLAGCGLYPDKETAEKARRKEGAFAGIGNVIYYRK